MSTSSRVVIQTSIDSLTYLNLGNVLCGRWRLHHHRGRLVRLLLRLRVPDFAVGRELGAAELHVLKDARLVGEALGASLEGAVEGLQVPVARILLFK